MARQAYAFRGEFAKAIIKTLGLEGQRITKLVLPMEVDKPIAVEATGWAQLESVDSISKVLTLSSWQEVQPYQSLDEVGPKT